MNRRYVVAAALFGIAACATSGPESPEPGANAANSEANTNSPAAEQEFEVVEVPEVPRSANMPPPAEVVCHREIRLGSRRATRVCRTQSEIDETQAAAEDTLKDLQKIQDIQKNQIDY